MCLRHNTNPHVEIRKQLAQQEPFLFCPNSIDVNTNYVEEGAGVEEPAMF